MKRLLSSITFGMVICAASMGADYGLPADIQDGNILHCFNWTAKEVKAELPNIAAAGFGSVQLSPLQRPDIRLGSSWHDLYRPYDLAFKSSSYCTEQDLKDLCTEAEKYGIKVIVDVVANHVDKTAGYHDPWWDSNNRVRWEGGISYGNRYSITHGQLGEYGDVNSELAEVAARGKAYVEKLKSLGVKGCRWDAAKHIGLPSEGCNFWTTVTSVPGMYHYGEILDEPASGQPGLIKEYIKYMSVTDNKYCNYAARDNGGIPGGYGGAWAVDQGVPANKLVYWGESHDTYSNDEWSQRVSQDVIDRAYAAYATREGTTALYLARPNTVGFNTIKVGKGSVAYKNKHIAEVNKFRNIMVGKKDWFESNGNACSITRQNGGAVIVAKNSGNVTIANGGGYCPAGTYTDRVSGNRFTVTASTISGNVGPSGIAVLYNDGISPEPNPNPNPNPDPQPTPDGGYYVYFDNTSNWNVRVWAWNDDENCNFLGTWPGDEMTPANGLLYWKAPEGKVPTQIIFSNNGGEKAGGTDLLFVNHAIYHPDGSYTLSADPTPDPNPVISIPEKLYVIGNLEGADWDTSAGIEMKREGNSFVGYNIKFVLHPKETSCFFNLTDHLGQDWDDLNANANRFGAPSEDTPLALDKSLEMFKYTAGRTAAQCKSWMIDPGTYNLIADFDKHTITLSKPTISGIDAVNADTAEADAVYFTLQGVKVTDPRAGIYIKVSGTKTEKIVIR
ncbi:MAG: starch-binding protein [Muribaculaceae bacterium]|nr:starch-binding protein [Muribaculaceae bacterium]